MTRAAAAFLVAVALVQGCGGSDASSTYAPNDVEQAFRDSGLPLQRLPSVGAEQPAMGETSSCGTRYLVRGREPLVSVSVCDTERDATEVASDPSMQRANVAVEYGGSDTRTHERISRALDALEG